MRTIKKALPDILFFFILLTIFSIVTLPRELDNLDEVWNYNFGKAIAEGKLPYKDFSMTIFPLYSLTTGFVLFLFGKELMVTRVLSIITFSLLLYITAGIFKLLEVRKSMSYFCILIFSVVSFEYFYYNYNSLILIISLLILYLELKSNLKNEILFQNTKNDILIGLLCGLAITMKQSTGLYITFFTLIYKLLAVKTKQDFKSYFIIFFKRCVGTSIPLLLLCIYLTINGIWKDFIEYAVWGIKYFNNSYSYSQLLLHASMIIRLLALILPVFLIVCVFKFRKDKAIISTLGLCIANMLVIFPIADECHFIFGCYISLILLVYVINSYTFMTLLFKAVTYVNIALIVMLSAISVLNTCKEYKTKEMTICHLNHFNNIPISKKFGNLVYPLVDYIKSQDHPVITLSANASVYNIPLDIYYKDCDMLLKGNIGLLEEHPERILRDDVEYLILKDSNRNNRQTPYSVIDYIKSHTEKVGEISVYDIYTVK